MVAFFFGVGLLILYFIILVFALFASAAIRLTWRLRAMPIVIYFLTWFISMFVLNGIAQSHAGLKEFAYNWEHCEGWLGVILNGGFYLTIGLCIMSLLKGIIRIGQPDFEWLRLLRIRG